MTIGLIILGVVAVIIFFGGAERYFEMLGITSWLAFIIILSMVLGAVVPDIEVGAVSISVGGFIVPLIVGIILVACIRKLNNLWRVLPPLLLTAIAAAGVRLLFQPEGQGAVLASSLIIGFACGALSFVSAEHRISILVAAIGGIIIGDVFSSAIIFATTANAGVMYFGAYSTFDSLVVACAFGLVLFEAINILKRTRISKAARLNLDTEAAEDVDFDTFEGEISARPAKSEMAEEESMSAAESEAKRKEDNKKILEYLDE